MAGRNRMNYASQNNGPYQGPSSFEGDPQQLGVRNPIGLGSGGGGRRGTEQSGSRRIPQQATPYVIMDRRFVSNRDAIGMAGPGLIPTPGAESMLNNHGQHIGGRSLSNSEGAHLGPGRVHPLSASAVNRHSIYENYSLSREQDQLADGPVRMMYPVPDAVGRGFADIGVGLCGGLTGELVGKDVMIPGYHGYVAPDEAKFAMGSASQNMQSIGCQGRQLVREGRLVQSLGYGREDDASFMQPPSPRTMPMSPRRDDEVRMMSPRRDDLSPPIRSRRDSYEDIGRMMSPRQDDLSPTINPRRRDYADMGFLGSSRLSREEELLQRQDFPMSPRRGAGLTPPMSPRVGWDYEASPLITPRLAVQMRPRPHSPPRSPLWRDGGKPASQWDVLPGKPAVWKGNDRQPRIGDTSVYGAEILRGAPERLGGGYGAEMDLSRDDYRGMSQAWSLSRRGLEDGVPVRPEEQDGLLRAPTVSGQVQMGRSFVDHYRGYRATNARPYPYNSVVNQRVGLVTKYIERERAEKVAAERVAKESANLSKRKYNGHAGNDKPFWTDRREMDVNSAAAASRNVNKSDKQVGGASDRSLSLVAAIENATKQSIAERTGDKTNGNKTSAGATSAENGNTAQQSVTAAAGTSSTPSTSIVGTERPEDPKAETLKAAGDAQKKDAGSRGNVRQNGLSSNSANGNSQINSKGGSEPVETREAPKRPSLVMEIERAKRSRILAEQRRHLREMEKTYYDANELSIDILSKVNRSGSRYSRMINDEPYIRRRYQGGQAGLHCLVCGKLKSLARPNQVGHMRSQRYCACRLRSLHG